MEHFDVIILGYSISALYLATSLIENKKKVIVVDNKKINLFEIYPTISYNSVTNDYFLVDTIIKKRLELLNKNKLQYLFDDFIVDFNKRVIRFSDKIIEADKIVITKSKQVNNIELNSFDKQYINKGIFFNFNDIIDFALQENIVVYALDFVPNLELKLYAKLFKKINLVTNSVVKEQLPDNIKVYNGLQYKNIVVKNGKIKGVIFVNGAQKRNINSNAILILKGSNKFTAEFDKIKKNNDSGIIVNELFQTNIKNVYACGEAVLDLSFNIFDYMSHSVMCAKAVCK